MTFQSFVDVDVPQSLPPRHAHPATPPATVAAEPLPATQRRLAFDAEAALARAEGDRKLLGRMIGLFARQWRYLCAEIETAGRYRDGPRLELTANKLKQSFESLGAGEASRVAQTLETSGRDAKFHAVAQACASVEVEIERLVADLKGFTVPFRGRTTPRA